MRCASSGWSRTAGGPQNPCKEAISRSSSPTVATSSSSASRRSRHGGALVRAAGVERAYVELHAHSVVLVLRRRLAARGARHPRRRDTAIRPSRSPTTTTSAGRWSSSRRAGARGAADRRRGAHGRCRRPRESGRGGASRGMFHLTLLVESATGWHNLCRLLTEAHAGDAATRPDRDPLPPSLALDSLLERNEGLVCLSGCAGPGALAGELGARRAAAGGGGRRGGWPAASAPSASGSSCSGRCGGATAPATGGWRSSPSGSGSPASRPATCTPTTAAGPSSRTRSSPCACTRRSRGPSPGGAATRARCSPRRRRWRRALPSTRRRSPRPRGSPSGCASTSSELGYRYPGSEDPDADRALAEICRGRLELRYAGTRERPEASGGSRRSCG